VIPTQETRLAVKISVTRYYFLVRYAASFNDPTDHFSFTTSVQMTSQNENGGNNLLTWVMPICNDLQQLLYVHVLRITTNRASWLTNMNSLFSRSGNGVAYCVALSDVGERGCTTGFVGFTT
jgi:hypothetical protein